VAADVQQRQPDRDTIAEHGGERGSGVDATKTVLAHCAVSQYRQA
jgi:hypothetical protein